MINKNKSSKIISNLLYFLAGVLFSCIFLFTLFWKECQDVKIQEKDKIVYVNGKPYSVIKRDTLIRFDTLKNTVWKTKVLRDTEFVSVPVKFDTSKIIKDFYSYRMYSDSLDLLDSAGQVRIFDTLYMNDIYSRRISYDIYRKNTETRSFISPIENQYYIGPSIQLNSINSSMNINLHLKSKQNNLYSIGIGMDSKLNPAVSAGIAWKIF